MTFKVLFRIIAIGGTSLAAFFIGHGEMTNHPPHTVELTGRTVVGDGDVVTEIFTDQEVAGELQRLADIDAYLASEHRRQVEEQEERERAAERDRVAQASQVGKVTRSSFNLPTECYGKVVPAEILIGESGCNYGAVSPSSFCNGTGCYGLYQISGAHWFGGACSDLNWEIPADQDECARRLSNNGTNLAPWGR